MSMWIRDFWALPQEKQYGNVRIFLDDEIYLLRAPVGNRVLAL
jgi:hypothetical protein